MERRTMNRTIYDLIAAIEALRDSLHAEAATQWNLDTAAILGSRADGIDLVLVLIEEKLKP
jgi:hypothetical protein